MCLSLSGAGLEEGERKGGRGVDKFAVGVKANGWWGRDGPEVVLCIRVWWREEVFICFL